MIHMINDLRSGMSIYKSLWVGSISIYNSDVTLSVVLKHADHGTPLRPGQDQHFAGRDQGTTFDGSHSDLKNDNRPYKILPISSVHYKLLYYQKITRNYMILYITRSFHYYIYTTHSFISAIPVLSISHCNPIITPFICMMIPLLSTIS